MCSPRKDACYEAGNVLNGPGHVVNKLGELIQTAIKPGTRGRVYYAKMGDLRMVAGGRLGMGIGIPHAQQNVYHRRDVRQQLQNSFSPIA
jgi:hypothetical protein